MVQDLTEAQEIFGKTNILLFGRTLERNQDPGISKKVSLFSAKTVNGRSVVVRT